MAKNQYSLVIKIQGGGGRSPVANGESEKKEKATPEEKVSSLVAHTVTRDFLSTTKQILMNDINTFGGSQELTQRISFGMGVVQKGIGDITGGLAMSKALGISQGGGILISMALSVTSFLFDTVKNMNAINNQRIMENQGLEVLRGRAGIQFNQSRSGE